MVLYLYFPFLAGDGVLWGWFNHRPGEEHQGEPTEGRLDCLHFQRDPAGESTLLYCVLYCTIVYNDYGFM